MLYIRSQPLLCITSISRPHEWQNISSDDFYVPQCIQYWRVLSSCRQPSCTLVSVVNQWNLWRDCHLWNSYHSACHRVKSLQPIGRSGTIKWNIWLELQMSCKDLSTRQGTWAFIHLAAWLFNAKYREVSNLQDWMLLSSYLPESCQASQQHCCRDASQISER